MDKISFEGVQYIPDFDLNSSYEEIDEFDKELSNEEEFDINAGILHHEEGIDLMPANIELSGVETSLVGIMSMFMMRMCQSQLCLRGLLIMGTQSEYQICQRIWVDIII